MRTLNSWFVFARRFSCAFVALSLLVGQLGAQTKKTPPQQRLSFISYGSALNENQFAFRDSAGALQPLFGTDGSYSGPFLRDLGPDIVIYRLVPPTPEQISRAAAAGVTKELPPTHVEVARFNLPSGSVNVLCLLAVQGEQLKLIRVLDQSVAAVPKGTIVVHNLSRSQAALRFGEVQTQVEPNTQSSIQMVTRTGKSGGVRYQFGVNIDGEWRLEESGRAVLDPEGRRLALVVSGGPLGAKFFMLPAPPDDPEPGPVLAAHTR